MVTIKPIKPMSVVIKRMVNWQPGQYVRYYAPAMFPRGLVTARVDMDSRRDTVQVQFSSR